MKLNNKNMNIYQKSFNVITWKDLKSELKYINHIILNLESEGLFKKDLHGFTHIDTIDTLIKLYDNKATYQEVNSEDKALSRRIARFLEVVYDTMHQNKIDFIDFTICD